MAGDRCTVSQMADVIMEGLEEYAQLAADDMKKAVKCLNIIFLISLF